MPTYGTKVPYKGHICALSGAMIQKNLLGTLILIPDRGNSFLCLPNWKELTDTRFTPANTLAHDYKHNAYHRRGRTIQSQQWCSDRNQRIHFMVQILVKEPRCLLLSAGERLTFFLRQPDFHHLIVSSTTAEENGLILFVFSEPRYQKRQHTTLILYNLL